MKHLLFHNDNVIVFKSDNQLLHGTVVSQKSFYECVDKLKGEAGSEVKLIIKIVIH